MNEAEKLSCMNINMDQLLYEIPNVIERIEDLSRNMDDKFGWKEFKFCFKFATSHIVSWQLAVNKDKYLIFTLPERYSQQTTRVQVNSFVSDAQAYTAG